jgi:hypothetical protein
MITGIMICLAGLACLAAGGLFLADAGSRAGDRPGDALVTARLGVQPCHSGPAVLAPAVLVLVTVRNPGAVPLMVGFSARPRRILGWLEPGSTVRVPRRTARRKFRAAAQEVLGVVPGWGDAEFAVPVPRPASRCLLTAVIGQSGERLRVIRMPVTERELPGPGGSVLTPRPLGGREY